MTVEEYNESVDLYADNLFRFVLKSIQDEDRARDLVQDAYEKLWRKVSEVSFHKVKSYLFSTAYHAVVDDFRKEKRHQEYLANDRGGMVDYNQYSDLNDILHQIIMELPEVQRSVILLRDYEGYSYREIAELTGLSESQVKVYIYRGRLFMKERIGHIGVLV